MNSPLMSELKSGLRPSFDRRDNDLIATSLEIMVNKGNHPQMALIQVSEWLRFT